MKPVIFLRRLHLWLGCLFAPLLIFFAITGFIQTLGWDGWATKSKPASELPAAQRLIVEMTEGHTAHRSPYVENADGQREYRPFTVVESDAKRLPYSAFVALMVLGMVATSGLGIWMAFRFGGSRVLVSLLLLAGILAPFLLYKLRG